MIPHMLRIAVFFVLCAVSMLFADQYDVPEWCRALPRAGYKTLERVLPGEPWFEVYKVRPGVFALYEPRQYEEVISYLIVGQERALLLDTGMGIASIRDVVMKLTNHPVMVLNTHTHPDHIGGNYEFDTILAMDTSFTRKNQDGYSDPEVKEWVSPQNVCGALPKGFDPDTYRIRPFRITRFVKDNEEIDLGGRKLRVLACPGHSPDSLCLLDVENRLLFTGDTFYPGPIYLYSKETDLDAYRKTITRLALKSPQVDTLLTAHNEPVADPANLEALESALKDIERGAAKGEENGGLVEYTFTGFSLLLQGPSGVR